LLRRPVASNASRRISASASKAKRSALPSFFQALISRLLRPQPTQISSSKWQILMQGLLLMRAPVGKGAASIGQLQASRGLKVSIPLMQGAALSRSFVRASRTGFGLGREQIVEIGLQALLHQIQLAQQAAEAGFPAWLDRRLIARLGIDPRLQPRRHRQVVV